MKKLISLALAAVLALGILSGCGKKADAAISPALDALDIAERVGHEAIDITYRYAHLFPAKRAQIADALSELRGE